MSEFSKMKDEFKPREKFKIQGDTALSDAELLAIIIQSGNKHDSVMTLSQKMIEKYNGLSNIFELEYAELIDNYGIGDAKALKIRAIAVICSRLEKKDKDTREQVVTPNSAFCLCSDFRYSEQEHFAILFLDNKSRLIERKILYKGTSTEITISPKEIFTEAIKKRSHAIIMIHNHPSGDTTPSYEDIATTIKIIDIGRLVGISVVDHIIVTADKYLSIRQEKKEIF